MEWTAPWVEELLTAPDRVLRQRPWRAWIADHGGLAVLHSHMRAALTSPPEQRLFAAMLAEPLATPAVLAQRLALHRTSVLRQRRALVAKLAAVLNHLPAAMPAPSAAVPQTAPLIGRDQECATLLASLRSPATRLVTITGVGGVGKTSLARTVAATLKPDYPDGLWFIPLVALQDAALLGPTLAQALGLRPDAAHPVELLAELCGAFQGRRALVVLDNLEHLLAGAQPFLTHLVANSHVTVLATSRVPLAITSEQVVVLAPLTTSTDTTLSPAALLEQATAVRLFVERARAAHHYFRLTPSNVTAVATLCQELDGLPLAIELAAAQIVAHTPQAILRRMRSHRAALQQDRPGTPPRHRTLWAMVDWSYNLLPPHSQRLFVELGVFQHGWSLELLRLMYPEHEPDLLQATLQTLTAAQLITHHSDMPAGERYGMLETIAAYAAERLAAQPDAAAIRHRHALAMVQVLAPCVQADDPSAAGTPFPEADYYNGMAALRWWYDVGATDHLLTLGIALADWWLQRCAWSAGLDWCERLLAVIPAPGDWRRAALLYRAARLAYHWSRDNTVWLEEALQILAAEDHPSCLHAEVLNQLASTYAGHRRLDLTVATYQQSLALWEQLGRPRDVARVQHNLGLVARDRQQYYEAEQRLMASLDYFQRAGEQALCALILGNLSSVLLQQGQIAKARQRASAGLALARQTQAPGLPYTLFYLLDAVIADADEAMIATLLAEAIQFVSEQPSLNFVQWLLKLQGTWWAAHAPASEAVTLLGAWSVVWALIAPNDPRPEAERWQDVYPTLCHLRTTMGAEPYAQAWAAGTTMDGAAAVRYARMVLLARTSITPVPACRPPS